MLLIQCIQSQLGPAKKTWIAQNKDRIEAQTQELFHKFQGILNKLTPQKFQALAEQALKLEINSEERLSGCVDKIFAFVISFLFILGRALNSNIMYFMFQAIGEPVYTIAYANLCKVMSPIKVEYTSEDGKTKQINFMRMLLIKCQREFEKYRKGDESLETMQKEIESAETVRYERENCNILL